MYIAHIRESDGKEQTLSSHCRNVAALCSRGAEIAGLSRLAELIGLTHDMGKATDEFADYLRAALRDDKAKSPHHHAPTGAIYAYRRWFMRENASACERAAAQIAMLCILGHHAGLTDCLDVKGKSTLLKNMKDEAAPVHADKAIAWFLQNIADEAELDALFESACRELSALFHDLDKPSADTEIALGLISRLMLSALVDADRWDSACFEYDENPFEAASAPDWNALLNIFERFRRTHLSGEGEINRIRADISDLCWEKAASDTGVVTLSVPTGGGKTFSSLRYALRHAALNGQRRIFYIIPYNTILDQNARDIREALADYPSILEHHSNVVIESEDERRADRSAGRHSNAESEDEQTAYKRLTERWDSDIILTSLVQFLNACYAAPNSAARRFHALTNAVLIFDEIQSLPKACKVLFERAIQFLTQYCRSTVVLCTATQPRLSLTPAPVELMPHVDALYERLKRVRYIPQLDADRTCASAGAEIARLLEEKSVLAILNTKAAAWNVYDAATQALRERGHALAAFDPLLPEDTLADAARACSPDEILCVHMSTLLCPAHRKKLIAWIKAWLRAGRRVLCVSTALIEAGINVSFPVVIRDLAGLPSVVQAAGRANRNMEYGRGDVLIWNFPEEARALAHLEDVQHGADITRGMLNASIYADALDSPATINRYFEREEDYYANDYNCCRKQDFPVVIRESRSKEPFCLTDLFGENTRIVSGINGSKSLKPLVLHQSFRTAGKYFYVIPDDTKSVIVPWGGGAELIAALNGEHDMREEIRLLRRAQAYSVNLYDNMYRRLKNAGAISLIGNSGVCALAEGFYSDAGGVSVEQSELELLEL